MNFSEHVLRFHKGLSPDWNLPKGFDLIYPFDNEETWSCMDQFYNKYFSDSHSRVFLLGINPGRFGAGVTGVAFTDPWHLEEICKIDSQFQKRKELSSIFVYQLIQEFGGPKAFYERFYISSVCPLGFLKGKVNCNYYDDKGLQEKVKPQILENLITQTEGFMKGSTVVCLGMGKNYKFLDRLNKEHKIFKKVIPLPHPRWIMQYRRKDVNKYAGEYLSVLEKL
ncbi:MAG: DUF4918 family protein [Saprospiraceae bacterium]|nr:DUF4918 family protein [Saprospiraceae bacterium]